MNAREISVEVNGIYAEVKDLQKRVQAVASKEASLSDGESELLDNLLGVEHSISKALKECAAALDSAAASLLFLPRNSNR